MCLGQNDERENLLLFCFLYASVYKIAAGGRCFVWNDLTEYHVKRMEKSNEQKSSSERYIWIRRRLGRKCFQNRH